jgi:hypothetical protein
MMGATVTFNVKGVMAIVWFELSPDMQQLELRHK